jgi:uncharacterized SAM-binding protein YcdF (DUF218 family)
MSSDKSSNMAVPPSRCVGPFRRALRILEHAFAVLALMMLLFWTLPIIDHVYPMLDRRTPLAPSQYIVCLGGEPYRVLEGVQLLKEGYAPKLIVSNHAEASEAMRALAIEWGARPDQVVVDSNSHNTAEHPAGVRQSAGLDPARDQCIIVTDYLHMARARACFEKAGFQHIIMCDPRWSRTKRPPESVAVRMRVLPAMLYEAAAWVEYKFRGYL